MKKKIANAVQLVLLIVSFIILNLKTIPTSSDSFRVSALQYIDLTEYFVTLIPMYALYILCAVMCIISIISKGIYKDGKAHCVVAILLFIITIYNVLAYTPAFGINEKHYFPGALFAGLLFAVVIISFAKRSSVIAESKETQQTVVNNIQKTSNADELKKYKDLLDNGAITQEEFENKKKELLGL